MLPADIYKKKVLLAPLDWGLGHATRCIPLISQLKEQENKLVFAGTQQQIKLVSTDFPDLVYEEIEGYNVRLNPLKNTYWQMLSQFRKIQRNIKNDRCLAELLAKKYKVDIIISDNRYGFQTESTFNIFLTHQLRPPVPKFSKTLSQLLKKYIEQFNVCWIPDDPVKRITAQLNEIELKIPIHFIGFLSRFKPGLDAENIKYLFIVSGTFMSRQQFTEELLKYLNGRNDFFIVTPDEEWRERPQVVVNPDTAELNDLINRSATVISRAGYTTIMELLSLNKKAILIPTPGQYEQQFLARNIKSADIQFLTEEDFFTKKLI